jgi:hypothetical protein
VRREPLAVSVDVDGDGQACGGGGGVGDVAGPEQAREDDEEGAVR